MDIVTDSDVKLDVLQMRYALDFIEEKPMIDTSPKIIFQLK